VFLDEAERTRSPLPRAALFWPAPFRDEVLARLLDLTAPALKKKNARPRSLARGTPSRKVPWRPKRRMSVAPPPDRIPGSFYRKSSKHRRLLTVQKLCMK